MNKRLSQVFLFDRDAIDNIAAAAPIKGKTVLEIGTGEAVLTMALSKQVGSKGKVVSLEIDKTLAPKIKENLKGFKNVEVNFIDALKFDFSGFKIIFGNIPYHISSQILFKILETPFEKAVLCLQKEFAHRLVAQPGSRDYARLSVMAQNSADVKLLFEIPRYSFVPIPKVDSAIVLLEKKKGFDLNPLLVNALFQHKNQKVKKALFHSRRMLALEKEDAKKMVEAMKFAETRVKDLTLQELEVLTREFEDF